MLRAFLTAEDPRELPKGSRDPLRFIPEWTAVARRMIPYLTTVTPSYRGFLTRLLFHGALEVHWPHLADASSEDQWPAFCRFEQMCAAVRQYHCETNPAQYGMLLNNLPGKTSIGNLQAGSRTVGMRQAYMLGLSQKTTGYWGYYHQASLGSGLLQNNNADRPGYRLTEEAMAYFGEQFAGLIEQLISSIRPVIDSSESKVQLDRLEPLAHSMAQQPFDQQRSGMFWAEHLLWPGPDAAAASAQRAFAAAVSDAHARMEEPDVHGIWEQLRGGSYDARVVEHAGKVHAAEAVIGLCEWVFDACRMHHNGGSSLDVARRWAHDPEQGFENWLDRLLVIEAPDSPELFELREVARGSDDPFGDLARWLLQRHKLVMRSRHGAPWTALEDDEQLTIREPSLGPGKPPANDGGPLRWRYDYFMSSWCSVASELGFLGRTVANA